MDPPECAGHSHDHDHQGDDLGLSLRKYVDADRVTCLNEEAEGMGRAVVGKGHDERLSSRPSLRSPRGDPELLLHVPFTEAVTVQSVTVRSVVARTSDDGGGDEAATAAPRRIKLFTDRETVDFDEARDLPAQQELELLPPDHFPDGTVDYPCRPAGRFQNISSLTVFVVDNYDASGESPTEITYVGFKGRGTAARRVAVETVYESQGMKKDHKVRGEFGSRSFV